MSNDIMSAPTNNDNPDDFSEFGTLPAGKQHKMHPKTSIYPNPTSGTLADHKETLANDEAILEASPAIKGLPAGVIAICIMMVLGAGLQIITSYVAWVFIVGCVTLALAIGLALRSNFVRKFIIVWVLVSILLNTASIVIISHRKHDLQQQASDYSSAADSGSFNNDPLRMANPYIDTQIRDKFQIQLAALSRASEVAALSIPVEVWVAYYLLRPRVAEYFQD